MRLAKEAKSQREGEAGQGRTGGGAPGLHGAKRRKIGEEPPEPLVSSLTGRGMCPRNRRRQRPSGRPISPSGRRTNGPEEALAVPRQRTGAQRSL